MTRTHILLAASLVLTICFSSCEKDPIQEDLIHHINFDGKPDGLTDEYEKSELPQLPQTKPDGYEDESQVEIGKDLQTKPNGYKDENQEESGEDPQTKIIGYEDENQQDTDGDSELKTNGYEDENQDKKKIPSHI
ncbi:MAG: hypothetical protein ACI959_000197 [Limisphaerales bacterium]|jgi:hypothetical protein